MATLTPEGADKLFNMVGGLTEAFLRQTKGLDLSERAFLLTGLVITALAAASKPGEEAASITAFKMLLPSLAAALVATEDVTRLRKLMATLDGEDKN